jgi:hypothetical protein
MDTKSHETCIDITIHKNPPTKSNECLLTSRFRGEESLTLTLGKDYNHFHLYYTLLDKTCHRRLTLKINRLKGMITSVFPRRLSHTNHSIYRELTAFLRQSDPSDPLASARPRTTLPTTQEITTIKTQEKGFSLRFSKGEPLKIDVLRSLIT